MKMLIRLYRMHRHHGCTPFEAVRRAFKNIIH